MSARVLFLIGIVAIAGCGGTCADSASGQIPSLEGNWWLTKQGTCEPFCDESDLPPECESSDCALVAFVRFSDGTSLSGGITISRTARQFSRFGPIGTRGYSIEGETIHYTAPETKVSFELEEKRLIMEQQPFDLAEPALSRALDDALATENWKEVIY